MTKAIDRIETETLRRMLARRREELLIRTQRVERDLAHAADPLVQDFADRALQTQNDEALEAIGLAAAEEARKIEHALDRLARGEYGVCETCGEQIAPGRLRVVPYATTCSRCG